MKTYTIRAIVEISLDAFNAEDAIDAVKDALGEVDSIGATLNSFTLDDVKEN